MFRTGNIYIQFIYLKYKLNHIPGTQPKSIPTKNPPQKKNSKRSPLRDDLDDDDDDDFWCDDNLDDNDDDLKDDDEENGGVVEIPLGLLASKPVLANYNPHALGLRTMNNPHALAKYNPHALGLETTKDLQLLACPGVAAESATDRNKRAETVFRASYDPHTKKLTIVVEVVNCVQVFKHILGKLRFPLEKLDRAAVRLHKDLGTACWPKEVLRNTSNDQQQHHLNQNHQQQRQQQNQNGTMLLGGVGGEEDVGDDEGTGMNQMGGGMMQLNQMNLMGLGGRGGATMQVNQQQMTNQMLDAEDGDEDGNMGVMGQMGQQMGGGQMGGQNMHEEESLQPPNSTKKHPLRSPQLKDIRIISGNAEETVQWMREREANNAPPFVTTIRKYVAGGAVGSYSSWCLEFALSIVYKVKGGVLLDDFGNTEATLGLILSTLTEKRKTFAREDIVLEIENHGNDKTNKSEQDDEDSDKEGEYRHNNEEEARDDEENAEKMAEAFLISANKTAVLGSGSSSSSGSNNNSKKSEHTRELSGKKESKKLDLGKVSGPSASKVGVVSNATKDEGTMLIPALNTTLVLVPEQMLDHWQTEINKLATKKIKVKTLKNLKDLAGLSIKEVQELDIVIMRFVLIFFFLVFFVWVADQLP